MNLLDNEYDERFPNNYDESELYQLYPELYEAIFVDKRNVLISGPGGTGKTYTARLIKQESQRLGIQCDLTSTTGVSAHGMGMGASTIHRWSGIKLGDKPFDKIMAGIHSKDAGKRWKKAEILVIDEISMLGAQILTLLDGVGKEARLGKRRLKKEEYIPPFGGVQLVLSADFMQLMPINDSMAFKSAVWDQLKLFYFRTVHPYRYPDENHFKLLQRLRVGEQTEQDIAALRERVVAYDNYKKTEKSLGVKIIKPTRLFPLRADVDALNLSELNDLEGGVIVYEANDVITAKLYENGQPVTTDINGADYVEILDNVAPYELLIKAQAQVMLTKNLDVDSGLVNGARGIVLECYDERIKIQFKSGMICDIIPEPYEFEDDRVVAVRSQFPLILAWGISIHKSQGSTLDYAIVDLGSTLFSPNMGYVAVSRCKTLSGILIKNLIPVMIRADESALQFETMLAANSVVAKKIEEPKNKVEDEPEIESSNLPTGNGDTIWTDGAYNKESEPNGWSSVVDLEGNDLLDIPANNPVLEGLTSEIRILPVVGTRRIIVDKFKRVKQQHNGAELLGLVVGLRLALLDPKIKIINCDSSTILSWSIGNVTNDAKMKMDNRKLKFIEELQILRKQFEERGGKIIKVSGSQNRADFGFHV